MPIPPEFDIAGKVFVAVGAGRGIGRGIVEVLAEAGAEGAVVALTDTYVVPLAERVSQECGRRVLGIAADGTDGAAMGQVLERVLAEFGRIDIWINAVGDSIPSPLVPLPQADGSLRPASPLGDAELRRVLDINLTATIVGCRAIGGHFVSQRAGTVINVSGAAGQRGGAGVSVYAAAKSALGGLTRALALEWAPFGVTVNCISPGIFPDVALLSAEERERWNERSARVPLQRYGQVREAGLLAVYLASAAGHYVTGQSISIDGGLTL